MEVPVSIVMASHLSDVQAEMSFGNPELIQRANNRLNFVKYLINCFRNLDERIDPDMVYKEFRTQYPQWAII